MNRKKHPFIAAAMALLASGMMLHAETPTEAALQFLKKVVSKKIDLTVNTDTAITAYVSAAKKKDIQRRFERMALDLADSTFEPGESRVDGRYAGVIIHRSQDIDPEKYSAIAVALVKAGDRWLPTPVAASFENTGVVIDLASRNRSAAIEQWLLEKQARTHDTLRNQARARMREEIEAKITRDQIQAMTGPAAAAAFLQACRERDTLTLLGLVGGLSDPLPDDWNTRFHAVRSAIKPRDDTPPAWHLLTSAEVLRATLQSEFSNRSGHLVVGCLDPGAGTAQERVQKVQILRLEIKRDPARLWQVNLPPEFTTTQPSSSDEDWDDTSYEDALVETFPTKIREAYPASSHGSADSLWQAMLHAFVQPTPASLISLLNMPLDSPEEALAMLRRVSLLWWQIHSRTGGRSPIPLAYHSVGDQAMGMLQLFNLLEPDRTDLRVFHMVRNADGWLWHSTKGNRTSTANLDESLVEWRNDQVQHWQQNWPRELLKPSVILQKIEPAPPVPAQEASDRFRAFVKAVSLGDLQGAIQQCATLDDDEGRNRLLRNIGYEVFSRVIPPDVEITTRSGKQWTVVTFRRVGEQGGGTAVVPVVATPDGPRLLLEIDLISGTRQRDFLNNVALDRLEDFASAETRDDLRTILQSLNREARVVPSR